ncbi:MAG: (Fe-S)-binding protein [Deltaproteobacteria bacterium]|nr:(Fe-S)-binding protein [Deltaproteobacteria bacterium]
MAETREIYWNIAGGALLYLFLAVAAAVFAGGVYRRYRLWRLGGSETRWDRIPERLTGLLLEIFGQHRQWRQPYPGLMHAFIFYGFLAQVVATSLISLQEWSGIHFLQGATYRWYSLLSDSFGLLAIVGLAMALVRRTVMRPRHVVSLTEDSVALGLLLLLFLQGFATEGFRMAATELHGNPALARWSPGGYLVALSLQGLSEPTLRFMHRGSWWFHAVTAFAFIGYLSAGKLNHIVYGALNIFFRNLNRGLALPYPDIEAMLEAEDGKSEPVLGAKAIQQYSWKSLLDLDACVNCGRCESVCPATLGGSQLNPRLLIRNLRDHLSAVGPSLLAAQAGSGAAPDTEQAPLFGDAAEGPLRPAVLEDELWGCRTCGACQQECPMYIEHIPKMIDMRRYLVMTESKMSDETQTFLKNIDERGHPFAGAAHEREEWFQDLDLKVYGRGDTAEYLFWVGCAGALVDRNIQVTRAFVKVLQAAGVDFAVLGAEESCTGDPARRAGGELTFQMCAKTNVELFQQYEIRKIITTCPHCFNTLANEYPDFGGKYAVVHHAEFIQQLLRSGRLKLKQEVDSVTYHDPCYLGRHNGIYDAPRQVLASVSRSGISEMPRNRSTALCCGAGGGYAWMDDKLESKINHLRFEEAKGCGAKTAAVSCPFCMQMFEDAIRTKDPERTVRAADIAELVAEALVVDVECGGLPPLSGLAAAPGTTQEPEQAPALQER